MEKELTQLKLNKLCEMAVENYESFELSCKFGFKCNTASCFFPCEECHIVNFESFVPRSIVLSLI